MKLDKTKELLSFQVKRNVGKVYKVSLNILESLNKKGIVNNEDFVKYRKKILDTGNDSIRELEDLIKIL